MNKVLILAGGIGTRAGTKIPKQFVEINNKPIIIHTLEKFNDCDLIDEIYVVCVDGWVEKLREYANNFRINKLKHICIGGKSGLESVQNGLSCLKSPCDDDIILIHDAVRPFIDNDSIIENINVANKYGLAMSAIDCFETLVYTEDEVCANKIIPRDGIKRILTPQSFKYSILDKLYKSCSIENCKDPSTFALYMRTGKPIYCSRGNNKNIKITYSEDIDYFRKLFGE